MKECTILQSGDGAIFIPIGLGIFNYLHLVDFLWFSCRQIYRSSHGNAIFQEKTCCSIFPSHGASVYRHFPTSNFSNRFFFRSKPSKISKLKACLQEACSRWCQAQGAVQPLGVSGRKAWWTYNPHPKTYHWPTPQKSRVFHLRRL